MIKKILLALALTAGLVPVAATPAQAHVVICEMTVYAPVILEAGDRDQIVYGVKHSCPFAMDMMFVEAQAMRSLGSGYSEYGAPVTYECGYGGRAKCKSSLTTFDWTYCASTAYYRTRGLVEGFHHTWGGRGPYSVPSMGGRWIDCTGHGKASYRTPLTAAEQAEADRVLAKFAAAQR